MFGRFRRGKRPCRCQGKGSHSGGRCTRPLSDFAAGADVLVVANSDRKTMEMGIFNGARIHLLQNHENEPNLVIALGDSRYTVPREIAAQISVR